MKHTSITCKELHTFCSPVKSVSGSLCEWRLGKIIPHYHISGLFPPPLHCPGYLWGRRGTEVQTKELSSAMCYKQTNTKSLAYIAPSSLPPISSAVDCRTDSVSRAMVSNHSLI